MKICFPEITLVFPLEGAVVLQHICVELAVLVMGESKRRKQVEGSSYGQPIPLEECIVPSSIDFGYAGDNCDLNHKMAKRSGYASKTFRTIYASNL